MLAFWKWAANDYNFSNPSNPSLSFFASSRTRFYYIKNWKANQIIIENKFEKNWIIFVYTYYTNGVIAI